MSLKERLEMERQDCDHESTAARLSGRGKFRFCHWCGRPDGMKSVHRETLEDMPHMLEDGEILTTWYREPGNDEYLFHPCLSCNRSQVIPGGFISMTADEVLAWVDCDPMIPDYAALAAEPEAATAGQDSRESAGMEG